jgi:putative DNA methylase
MPRRPRVLIEDWLPVAELGIESVRERRVYTDLPPLFALHVWWARRPLAASSGVILASLLPAWSQELADRFHDRTEVHSNVEYRAWFLRLCGILGDSVSAARVAAAYKASGTRASRNPYEHTRAFKNSPSTDDLYLLSAVLDWTWGSQPRVCDPTAGGGSIPFEVARYGIPVLANDLNPVAAAILRAGVAVPSMFGLDLVSDLRLWGNRLVERASERLAPFFPAGSDEQITNYLFARTIRCPRTGKPVPLSPNWRLGMGIKGQVAVRLVTERRGLQLDEVEFEIVAGEAAKATHPDRGTVAGGDAISPWDNLAIDGDYIKAEAQAGRMGSQLYAVAVRRSDGTREFRTPSGADLDALEQASKELNRVRASWLQAGVLPTEEIGPESNYDRGHRLYGIETWASMFSERQLLVHGTYVEEFRAIVGEVKEQLEGERATAVLALLGMTVGKAVNYNAISSSWIVSRQVTRSVFDSHNFAFKWTYAEFEGSRDLYGWALSQLIRAYSGIAKLLLPSDSES